MHTTRRFSFEAGRFVLGSIKNALLEGAASWGVEIRWTEGSGWLSRPLYVVVEGKEENVDGFYNAVLGLMRQLEA